MAALRDQPKLLEEYEKKLEDLATILENDDSDMNLDLRAQKLTDSMNKIARELLPKKVPIRLDLPWRNDLEILSLKSQRNNLKNCQNDKAEFRRLSTLIKKRANALRSEFYLKQAEGINLAAQSRDLEKLFRRATNHDAFNQAAAPPAARADFRGHFGRHFNKQHPESSPQELDEMPDYLIKALDDALDPLLPDILIAEPPTQDEVTAAIKGLKARKASEDVAPELLKAALECPSFMAHLTDLYGEIWEKKSIPLHWRYARLKALYKNKGKADDAGNYRGISVGSTQLKVLCVIILTRMREWYEGNLSEGQYGFRAKRGCQDAIYGLKRVQQIYHHQLKKLFCGFIDLKAAFDWVPREWMFKSIRNRNIKGDPKISENLQLFEGIYKETYNYIDGDDQDQAFRTTSGVRQGGVESPCLFNLYLDYMVRIFEKEAKEKKLGVSIKFRIQSQATDRTQRSEHPGADKGDLWLLWLGFADDLAILADSAEELQQALEILYSIFTRFGLQMSLVKTETMIMSADIEEENYPESICTLDGQKLKNVKTFKYLGQKFQFNEPYTASVELLTRKMSAITSFYKDDKFFKNHAVSIKTRLKIYDSLFRSKLTYACQTWSTTQAALKPIEAAYRQNLRCLVRGGQSRRLTPLKEDLPEDHEDQKFDQAYIYSNAKILEITKARPLKEFIEEMQLNWYAHVIRLPNNSNIKRLTFPDHPGKGCRRGQGLLTLQKSITSRFDRTESQINQACLYRKQHELLPYMKVKEKLLEN